jgi:hypothetical protein
VQEQDFNKIRETLLSGPRLNSLLPYFEKIAAKIDQIPSKKVEPLAGFLQSKINQDYYKIFQKNRGTFFEHAFASIPFVLEEHCRVNIALHRFAEFRKNKLNDSSPLTLYELSAADGTNARTLAEFSEGCIKTLTDTPNEANGINFEKLCSHDHSHIYIGPFADITPGYLLERDDLPYFWEGFDIIQEPAVFQMYGKNRTEQIAYVRRLLKQDGLFFMMEKLVHPDPEEYIRREKLKDEVFKSNYFTQDQIDKKKTNILHEMREGQVSYEYLLDAIKDNFKYAWLIWNSANFYEIVASDSLDNLTEFISLLDDPYIPEMFNCEKSLVMQRIL